MISDRLKPSCYVFVEGLHAEAVICAVLQLDLASGTGYFRYGTSWLERFDAFPLDPIHLPLSEQEFICRLPKAVFGVLSDAAPDSWGRNHALLLDLVSKDWRLSPAYDMVPVNNSRQHAMGLGDFGRVGTVENALSQCSRFGLKLNKARQIVAEAEQVVLSWPQHFIKAGVSATDIEVLKAMIPH